MSIILLWDLNLGNVEAIPYIKLCVTSPLLPPPLEDVNRYPHFPGLHYIGSSHYNPYYAMLLRLLIPVTSTFLR
ncbi:hypothetical protein F5877DRAFT_86686 [Lentinula edodes]|nr:hypothetical protein F5877DRAFT_86686 [Lentinula edodes]